MNKQLLSLYHSLYGAEPASVTALSGSASNRQYYRLTSADGVSCIGVVGNDFRENHAFLYLSRKMELDGQPVPHILAASADEMCYLQQDLGQQSLYDLIARCQKSGEWDDHTVMLLHRTLELLPYVQYQTHQNLHYAECCRQQPFDAQVVRWDLNYFKYCFLKPSGLVFDEARLQQEFDLLEADLLKDNPDTYRFLYRDFQSRNVMVQNDNVYFIDYQGGYCGPIFYDVASFLWQARAGYSEALRNDLLATYHKALLRFNPMGWDQFLQRLQSFVFFRMLQVLGAYGFRGLFERKAAFISPIAQALTMIKQVVQQGALANSYPHLCQLLGQLGQLPMFQPQPAQGPLTVHIYSFSYKKGIPEDNSGNGGGFVFDCRAPHNPGRYKEFKTQTGLEQPVIDFLEGRIDNPEYKPFGTELTMPQYMEHVYALVDPAVETYLTRGFTSLQVCFGCTGGQHRSVYGAQHLADHLKALYPDLRVVLTHREQGIYKEM